MRRQAAGVPQRHSLNKLAVEKVCEVYALLAGGVTISQTARLAGVCKEAVLVYANALGDISESWYEANVVGLMEEDYPESYSRWLASAAEVTVAGFTFRPLTEDTLTEARRFAIAKAKQAKRPESLRHLVALRVLAYVLCEGDPTPAMRMAIEPTPTPTDALCRNLLEQAEDFDLLSWAKT